MAQYFEHTLPANKNLKDLAGPSLCCAAQGLEHLSVMVSGVLWSGAICLYPFTRKWLILGRICLVVLIIPVLSSTFLLRKYLLACLREWNKMLKQSQPNDTRPSATHSCLVHFSFQLLPSRFKNKLTFTGLYLGYLSPSISFMLAVGSWATLPHFLEEAILHTLWCWMLWDHSSANSHCPLKTDVGQDPALLCLVVLKIGPFAWTVAQVFLQVQTFTMPLGAAWVFFSGFCLYMSLPCLAFGGGRNAQELKDLWYIW